MKLAVISVSAGAGHIRAAQAFQARAAELYPKTEVKHIDLMDCVSRLFRQLYSKSYIKLIKYHPHLWGYLYDWTDKQDNDTKLNQLREKIEHLQTRKFRDALESFNPDAVICTHFLPAQLLSKMKEKNKLDIPVWVQVTDFDVHKLWIHPHMNGYFAASEEVAWRMHARGINRKNVHVTGIPVMPEFTEHWQRSEIAAEFSLDPNRFTILLAAGGAGVGNLDQLARSILTIDESLQVIVLAGKNEELLKKLNTMKASFGNRLCPMGFTKRMPELMAAADIAVTKPGGLTTSECLVMHLPMILVSPIPGQEERNSDYLLENGAAMKAYDEAGLTYRIHQLLDQPEKLRQMQDNTRRIAGQDAAGTVLSSVMHHLP